ncbi:MAG: hypothetical protein KFB96_25025 [Thiocapsa sp.]|uniref:hypothetical protein n=1 Tax=Thiocapsa sp. TaxID=2024551 RepID=UPI001BCFD22F|nr:hypothetical protein [Thiocapsa sp.]QVL48770.1 MAG: hypothetical protein KFB96_25025 [Thiocapsa sp.]
MTNNAIPYSPYSSELNPTRPCSGAPGSFRAIARHTADSSMLVTVEYVRVLL